MDKSWNKIYDEHAPTVRAVLFRMGLTHELDDVLQECFIKVWKNRDRFRGESSMKTWIIRIAVNAAHDHFRRRGVDLETETIDEETIEAPSVDPDHAPEALRAALASLSVNHREVLVLHVLEECPVEEVASVLGISEGTVKSRLHYARERLHKILVKRGVKYE